MKSYSSRDVIRKLLDDGWEFAGQEGSHRHFKHPSIKGKATVPHPKSHIPIRTLKNIEKQTGIRF